MTWRYGPESQFEPHQQLQSDDKCRKACPARRRNLRYDRPLGRPRATAVQPARTETAVSGKGEHQAVPDGSEVAEPRAQLGNDQAHARAGKMTLGPGNGKDGPRWQRTHRTKRSSRL